MRTFGSVLTAVGAVCLLIVWVVVCSFSFWTILHSPPLGVTGVSLESLAWPFVVVLFAVPLLAIFMLGGLKILGQIISLKEFLGQLPQQVATLEKLAGNMQRNRELIEIDADLYLRSCCVTRRNN